MLEQLILEEKAETKAEEEICYARYWAPLAVSLISHSSGRYADSVGICLPTVRVNVSVPSSRGQEVQEGGLVGRSK